MSRPLLAATAAVVVGWLLACSGMPVGVHENAAACKAYVKKFNGLKCVPDAAKLDAAQFCPASLDMNPVDMGPYWECMAQNARCKNKMLDISGQTSCTP